MSGCTSYHSPLGISKKPKFIAAGVWTCTYLLELGLRKRRRLPPVLLWTPRHGDGLTTEARTANQQDGSDDGFSSPSSCVVVSMEPEVLRSNGENGSHGACAGAGAVVPVRAGGPGGGEGDQIVMLAVLMLLAPGRW